MDKPEVKKAYSALLDYWSPPPDAGDPVGCVATSFTFDPVFFEEECLSRFLKMESDPDEDGPVFIIEREEKISSIRCAAAIIDQHHAKGKRSLRWDLLPVRMSKGIMHAKITVLHWAGLIRVIIGSANLTPQGYRINQEVFGVMDYYEGSEAPLGALREICGFIKTIIQNGGGLVDSPGGLRVMDYLDNVVRSARRWGRTDSYTGSKDLRLMPVLTGPRMTDIFEQMKLNWNEATSRPPKEAYVTSPFFDPPGSENLPARKIWEILNQRGSAGVVYSVKLQRNDDGKSIFVYAPESLNFKPGNREDVSVDFYEMKDIVKSGKGELQRPLHLKSVWLQNDDWVMYLIGSSNFTSAGTGLSRNRNYEANLAYMASISQNNKTIDRMLESTLDEDDITDGKRVIWQQLPNEDDVEDEAFISLPAGFRYAVYTRTGNGESVIEMYFEVSELPGSFEIQWENRIVIYDHLNWLAQNKPSKIILPWYEPIAPSGFEVILDAGRRSVWWPVQVFSQTVLPPAPELKDLPMEVLITVLTSARPLHAVLRNWIRKKTVAVGNQPELDPHKRVDTAKFLFQRTRQVAWALNTLRAKLQRPCYTIESLNWRLRGPVSIMALITAILREGKSEQEKAFLISEIALELGQLSLSESPGSLPVEVIKKYIKDLIKELLGIVKNLNIADSQIEKYVCKAFNKASS